MSFLQYIYIIEKGRVLLLKLKTIQLFFIQKGLIMFWIAA